MPDLPAEENPSVRVKAAVVDPASMTVVWMNESAHEGLVNPAGVATPDLTIEHVLPMAAALGISEVLAHVTETGEARHLKADLVSTSKGSMAFVVSVYRLPDGMVLVLAENTWHLSQERSGAGRARGRRGRSAR